MKTRPLVALVLEGFLELSFLASRSLFLYSDEEDCSRYDQWAYNLLLASEQQLHRLLCGTNSYR